jgi:hypothetical protein
MCGKVSSSYLSPIFVKTSVIDLANLVIYIIKYILKQHKNELIYEFFIFLTWWLGSNIL